MIRRPGLLGLLMGKRSTVQKLQSFCTMRLASALMGGVRGDETFR
jgi:hypothetical protein